MSHEVAREVQHYQPDTIASGTTSAVINVRGGTLVAIQTPASIVSTTFTIQAAVALDGTYTTVKDPVTGTQYTGIIAASGWYFIPPSISAGLKYFKVVYSATETAKTFNYIYRPID